MPPPTTSQSYGTAPDGADGPFCEPVARSGRDDSPLELELARVRWAEYGRMVYAG